MVETSSAAATKAECAKSVYASRLPNTKFEIQVPTNAELAANLKGHLLLVHGEIDNNVHPANTMRLVDALDQGEQAIRHAHHPRRPPRVRIGPALLHPADVGLLLRAPPQRPPDRGRHLREGSEEEVVTESHLSPVEPTRSAPQGDDERNRVLSL